MLVLWLALSQLLCYVSAMVNFEGCYYGIQESRGTVFTIEETNLNEDCAHFCGSRGDILAATRGDKCICTNHMPDEAKYVLMKPYEVDTISVNPCSYVCPGASHLTTVCKGDNCCGGRYQGQDTYSVYTTGGIDVISVILFRLKRAINSGLPWVHETTFQEICENNFIEKKIKHGFIDLAVKSRRDTRTRSRIASLEDCKRICKLDVQCRSMTYLPDRKQCKTYKKMPYEAEITPSRYRSVLMERNCSDTLEILPGNFQIDLVSDDTMVDVQPGLKREPLDDLDFELDLTNSNYWDNIRRTYDLAVGEDVTTSTDSGFETRDARSETTSSQQSEEKSTDRTQSSEKSESHNFGVTIGASATVEGSAFGVTASGTVSAEARFGGGFSSSSSQSNTQSESRSRSNSQSYTGERSLARTFSNGYFATRKSDKRTSMEFSLTVPAFHKGSITFTKENRKTIVKIRSTFQLNGYLKFLINGVPKEVHVSRVLAGQDRFFATMGTVVFDRPIVTAKTTIMDRYGQVIENAEQLIENEEKQRIGR